MTTAALKCAIAWLCVLALIGGYSMTVEADIEMERYEHRQYCQMVAAGAWGDYDPDIDCPWRTTR